MVVTCFGDNVEEIVVGIDDRIPLMHHVHGISPTIIPIINDDVGIYPDITLHLRQRTPHSDGLSFASQVSIIDVNKLPVFVGITWRIFIRAYIHLSAIKPGKELVPDGVQEGVSGWVIQVKKLF